MREGNFYDIFEGRRFQPPLYLAKGIASTLAGCQKHQQGERGSDGGMGEVVVENVVFDH